MRANLIAPSFAALAVALASTGAAAQGVVSRSISAEPVETTVTQTPDGTIVTRRPVEGRVVAPSVVQQPIARTAPAIVESDPDSIDSITTREVVERAEATRAMRAASAQRMTKRQVSARRTPERQVTTPQRQVIRKVTRSSTTTTRQRLALNPRERHVVYQTIVERQVLPRQEVVVAPPPVVGPALIEREVALPTYRPPIVAADEEVAVRPAAAVYAVGSVLPPNVPLYAMPQNVALSVPATQTYSYAYLGGHAYLVDPASGIIVADVTE
jgi:hypothetical protein